MGQVYSVEAKFVFKNNDPTSFCEAFNRKVNAKNGSNKSNDPFECFKMLTATNAHKVGDCWYAGFDASYGWEGIMIDFFDSMIRELEDGSYVTIYPDYGWETLTVKDGEVTYTYGEEEDDEDEDEEDDE